MPLFEIPKKTSTSTSTLLDKMNRGRKTAPVQVYRSGTPGKTDLPTIINNIKTAVASSLGKYASNYVCVREEEPLSKFIDAAIKNGVVSYDTETTGLDPLNVQIAGFSMYTPGQKAIYVPLNHLSYITGVKTQNQLDEKTVLPYFQKLIDHNAKFIMFNSKFDIRVTRHTLGIDLPVYWDGFIAARLLNENEQESNLKALYTKYCLDGKGDAFRFDDLFESITFSYVPINTGYIYAAHDAFITYELYKFQEPFLTEGSPDNVDCELEKVAKLFHEIEMPLVKVVADMEDRGVYFDLEIREKFSKKYNAMLTEKEKTFHEICKGFSSDIDSYRRIQGMGCKLNDPISIGSPVQLSILLYDILKLTSAVKDKPRGTGEECIKSIKHPIVKAILDYREVAKILDTFVDALHTKITPSTGKIHASFNSVRAVTGRFSSSDPNLQQIPSRGSAKEIRKMFRASPGHLWISCDYSSQEPRITAHMSNDVKMIQAYRDNKDLYCEIASLAFDTPYEECQEHYPDGTKNPRGAKLRGQAKAIVLGVTYGEGMETIAENLQTSKQKARAIYDKVMLSFPGLKQFMFDNQKMARERGYVDTVWGRKRRLPDMQLEKYEFSVIKGSNASNFNPLDFEEDGEDDYIDPELVEYYTQQLNKSWGSKKWEIIQEAKKDGLHIVDNGGRIAKAERQCTNSRVQGSAADMSKIAMNLIHNDPILREWGYKLLLPVHDELIGEAPYATAFQSAKRVSELMVQAASPLNVPMKADTEISFCWYGKTITEEDVADLLEGRKTEKDFVD